MATHCCLFVYISSTVLLFSLFYSVLCSDYCTGSSRILTLFTRYLIRSCGSVTTTRRSFSALGSGRWLRLSWRGGRTGSLVQHKNFSSEFDSWIDLRSDPDLKSFVEQNQANPISSSLARHQVPTYNPNDEYRLSIHRAVFMCGTQRATPNVVCIRARMAYVKLPLPKVAFLNCFAEGSLTSM